MSQSTAVKIQNASNRQTEILSEQIRCKADVGPFHLNLSAQRVISNRGSIASRPNKRILPIFRSSKFECQWISLFRIHLLCLLPAL